MNDDEVDAKLARLATVPMGDSLYERALLLRCGLLLQKEAWEEDRAACEEGIRLHGPLEHYFHLDKGTVLAHGDGYKEGMAYFDQCILRYPGSFIMRYMKGLSAMEHKDYPAALTIAQDLVRRFPIEPRGHALLAQLARQEGHTAQAAMAYALALTVSWGGQSDEGRLAELNTLLSGSYDTDPHDIDLGKGDDFTDIDLLLKNRVAMEKKYKVEPDLAYPMCRQSHLLFTWLQKNEAGNGFWSQYYVPFFKRMMQEHLFEGWVYHCLSSSSNNEVNALARKNTSEVKEFRDKSDDIVHDLYRVFPDSAGAPAVDHWYYNEGGLRASGAYDRKAERFTGIVTNYHSSGAISSQGALTADHKRDGPWVDRFTNGRISHSGTYSGGTEQGVVMTYYNNGAVNDSAGVVNGLVQGVHHHHDRMGGLREVKTFKDDKLDGPAREYHPCGTLQSDYANKNGVIDGNATTYFPDGRKDFEGTYANGHITGTSTSWHHNGNKRVERGYLNGEGNGPYKEWYANGKLKAQGNMTAGKYTGAYEKYTEDGILSEQGTYDDNGRSTGTTRYYNEDGTLFRDEEYQHDLLVRYHYYGPDGKVLAQGERKKGKFQFEGVYRDGHKYVSGVYLDEGLKDGKWTYYYPDGTVSSEETMDKGKVTGLQRNYDEAGHLTTEWNYTAPDRSGTYTEFYMSGKPHVVAWLEHGKYNGSYREYQPDGTLLADKYLVDGSLTGWQRYYDIHGVPERTDRVVDGSLRERILYGADGKEFQYIEVLPGTCTVHEKYENGKVGLDLPFTDGELNGRIVHYFPNGVISREGHQVNGEYDGRWVTYYSNGKKNGCTHWDMGMHVGTDSTWFRDGTLQSIEEYAFGSTNGIYRLYDQNGTPVLERHRLNGQEHGLARSWTPQGDLQLFRYYDHDRLLAYANPKADHTPADSIPLQAGLQDLLPKFPNGQPAREMHLRNGEMDGVYKEFYANGTLLEQTPYSGGKVTGTSVEYYPDGKLKSSTEYVDGMRHGAYLFNGPNGKKLEEGTYYYGDLDGEYHVYNTSGVLASTYIYRGGTITDIK